MVSVKYSDIFKSLYPFLNSNFLSIKIKFLVILMLAFVPSLPMLLRSGVFASNINYLYRTHNKNLIIITNDNTCLRNSIIRRDPCTRDYTGSIFILIFVFGWLGTILSENRKFYLLMKRKKKEKNFP